MSVEFLAKLALMASEAKDFDSLKAGLLSLIAGERGPGATSSQEIVTENVVGTTRGVPTVLDPLRGPKQNLSRGLENTQPKAAKIQANAGKRESDPPKTGKHSVPASRQLTVTKKGGQTALNKLRQSSSLSLSGKTDTHLQTVLDMQACGTEGLKSESDMEFGENEKNDNSYEEVNGKKRRRMEKEAVLQKDTVPEGTRPSKVKPLVL